MGHATRERVVDAATKLFAEKGHTGVSLQDIADGSGIGISSVSGLFSDVDELYGAVLETEFGLYAARMGAVFEGDGSPQEKTELFALAMYDIHKQSPCFFPLFYRELLNPSPFFEPVVKKNIQRFAYLSDNNIARGIRKGQFKRGINPAYATMILAGMHHYYFLARRLAESLLPEPATDEEYAAQALRVFLTGLKKEGEE